MQNLLEEKIATTIYALCFDDATLPVISCWALKYIILNFVLAIVCSQLCKLLNKLM